MLPILLSGCFGFFFLFAAWMRIGSGFFSRDFPKGLERMQVHLENGDRKEARNALRKYPGFVAKELRLALDKSDAEEKDLKSYLTERLLRTHRYLEKGTYLISVMAVTAPLLGLLGTVTGMVATFKTITLYGNSNPILLADGISEALITTQSGLLIAFPLTLLKQRLDDRMEYIKQQLELGFTFIWNYKEKRKEAL
ncbi:MAG: MotA/TolQ/ExbB proton channel family protein [Fibrobacteraceae bacterium]